MTNSAKHTPGPWCIGKGADGAPIICEPPNSHSTGQGIAHICRRPVLGNGSMEANARLIAAAPELLEVVKTLTELLEGFREHPIDQDLGDDEAPIIAPALDEAYAAIRKATGETP